MVGWVGLPHAPVCTDADVLVCMLLCGCLLLQVEEIAKIASTNKLFGGNCTIPRVLQEMMSELPPAALAACLCDKAPGMLAVSTLVSVGASLCLPAPAPWLTAACSCGLCLSLCSQLTTTTSCTPSA